MGLYNYAGRMDLFPSCVHKFVVDKEFLDSTPSVEQIPTGWTANSKTNFIDVLELPDFKTIHSEVLKLVVEVAPKHERIGKWKIATAWMNCQMPKQVGFDFHSHADSFLSAVLYLKGKDMSLGFKDSYKRSNPGDTATCVYDFNIAHSWHKDEWIPVQTGDLIIFPSYQLHKPNENKTDADRVSIAYNFMADRVDYEKRLPWSMKLEL